MAFGIICDKCGDICSVSEGGKIKAYEIQIDSIHYIDNSRTRERKDLHLCCDCKQEFEKFLQKKGK